MQTCVRASVRVSARLRVGHAHLTVGEANAVKHCHLGGNQSVRGWVEADMQLSSCSHPEGTRADENMCSQPHTHTQATTHTHTQTHR